MIDDLKNQNLENESVEYDVPNILDQINEAENAQISQEEVEQYDESTEQESQHIEDNKAYNFRALNERANALQKERDEALRRLEELQSSHYDDNSIAADDLVEGKHLKKTTKYIRDLEQKVKEVESRNKMSTDEMRLRIQYPDIDKVVNEKTLRMLHDADPELAASLNANPDFYTKASSVYKVIKKFGIYKEDTYAADRERAQRNAIKPKPLATISPQHGDSPLSSANMFANGLTDDLKNQLRREMEEARKRH